MITIQSHLTVTFKGIMTLLLDPNAFLSKIGKFLLTLRKSCLNGQRTRIKISTKKIYKWQQAYKNVFDISDH